MEHVGFGLVLLSMFVFAAAIHARAASRWIPLACLSAVILCVGLALKTEGSTRTEAVEKGHARYTDSGDFEWLPPCKPGHMGSCVYTVPIEEAK